MNTAMGLVALAALAGFLGILVGFVPRADLIVVAGACFAFAAFDLLSGLRRKH